MTAAEVLALCRRQGLTLTTAESCTGGLAAKELTDVPGASAVFVGGVVSYWSEVKAKVLGVPRPLLVEYGAVSEPVARAMAEGARRLTGADIALSVTGVAGPDRDDRGNAVGTVFIALAAHDATLCRSLAFSGGRDEIRRDAVSALWALLADYINKEI